MKLEAEAKALKEREEAEEAERIARKEREEANRLQKELDEAR